MNRGVSTISKVASAPSRWRGLAIAVVDKHLNEIMRKLDDDRKLGSGLLFSMMRLLKVY